MSENFADLKLTETFHRLKRTAVLFSSGLFILHLAYDGKTGPLKLPILGSSADLPLQLAFFLIWVAATYYTAGFVLEWRSMRRGNSDAFKKMASANFEAQVASTTDALKQFETFIKETREQTSGGLAEAIAAFELERDAFAKGKDNNFEGAFRSAIARNTEGPGSEHLPKDGWWTDPEMVQKIIKDADLQYVSSLRSGAGGGPAEHTDGNPSLGFHEFLGDSGRNSPR